MDITIPAKNNRKNALMKRILISADNIFSTNRFLKAHVAALGVPTESYMTFVPVPQISRQQPTLQEQDDLRQKNNFNNAFILLSIGRLVKRKGHMDVIQAVKQLLPQHPQLHYVIGGTGEEEVALREEIIKNNLHNNVHLLGFIHDRDLATWYATADIFIMPSYVGNNGDIEGFGIVFLEAAFYGTPAIGGKSGGMGEAIQDGETGYLVADHDIDDLVEKIASLIAQPHLLQNMGHKARMQFVKQLSWDKEFHKIIACLT